MDAIFRTPLLDCFASGEAPPEVRQLAASGALAPRVHEQIALLVLLAADPDPAIRETTERTLARLPAGPLAGYLARPDTGPEVRAFFAARGVQPAGAPRASDAPLLEADGGDSPAPAEERVPATDDSAAAARSAPRLGTAQRLATLSVADRLKVAMQGSARGAGCSDPRPQPPRVVGRAEQPQADRERGRGDCPDDERLRRGAAHCRHDARWTKNYHVIAALARNAKTPVAMSLTLMSRLVERDLKMLSTDRNVPEPIRLSARKLYVHGNERRQ